MPPGHRIDVSLTLIPDLMRRLPYLHPTAHEVIALHFVAEVAFFALCTERRRRFVASPLCDDCELERTRIRLR